MQNFYNIRFPESLTPNSINSIFFLTEIAQSAPGKENRHNPYPYGVGEYEIRTSVTTREELTLLTSFFRTTKGILSPFRFKE